MFFLIRKICKFFFSGVLLLVILLCLVLIAGLFLNTFQAPMPGVDNAGFAVPAAPADLDLHFYAKNIPKLPAAGVNHSGVLEELLDLINQAEVFLVLNLPLLTVADLDYSQALPETGRKIFDAVLQLKARQPDIFILFITDALPQARTAAPVVLRPLLQAGVHVVSTDLQRLPDSNLLRGAFLKFRNLFRGLASRHKTEPSSAGSELDSAKTGLRQRYQKANNRNVIVAETAGGARRAMLLSGGVPGMHDSAGVALSMKSAPAAGILNAELEIVRAGLLASPPLLWSRDPAQEVLRRVERMFVAQDLPEPRPAGPNVIRAEYLTENKIADKLSWILGDAGAGDIIDIVNHGLTDKDLLLQLRAAAARGAELRVLLDPGFVDSRWHRYSIPNQAPAAGLAESARNSAAGRVEIRWAADSLVPLGIRGVRVYNRGTGGEKMLLTSADFTAAGLRGQRLEAAVYLENAFPQGYKFQQFFHQLWENKGGVQSSVDFNVHAGSSILGRLRRKISRVLGSLNLAGH